MSILSLKNISYLYGANTPFEHLALDNVSLTFTEGRITGLVGHTGSGKSTLAMLLNGLEKPTAGTVTLDGTDIWEKPHEMRKIRAKVGLVFQYPEYQLFEETVEKDIAFGPKNMGKSEEECRELVRRAADFTGISEEMLARSPFELSGGERRRVAIAGVLAMNTDVLVLDEPAAGLDPKGREDILGGVRAWQREKNKTVVLISHSMEDMARYADELAVLKDARLVMHAATSEVFKKPEVIESAGLCLPQITRITNRLKAYGIPEGITTPEEAVSEILKKLR
ncbi:MAG: energy-coupling factor transporter ATPase [Clostridia bacterium]|nr:energy-coupling factor transporter ATPase [Clostridia bacterium]